MHSKWQEFVKRHDVAKKKINIGIAGKYMGLLDSYASILKAIEHAATENNARARIKFIDTTLIENGETSVEDELEDIDGLIIPGGFGIRGAEGKVKCVKYAREKDLPFLGLCFGFQMAVLEFARNACGIDKANSTELEPECIEPVIDILPEQKNIEGLGGNMRLGVFDVSIKKDTIASRIYGSDLIRLRFRHRYEVDPKYIDILEGKGLVFSGKAPKVDIMQILELPDKKFFMATQAHPEFNSRPLKPEPMFNGFVKACLRD